MRHLLLVALATVGVMVPAGTTHCNEDQIIVWSGRTNTHSRCLDIDDPATKHFLVQRGLKR